MALKEFKARLESDAAFRAKFADVKDEADLVARAKAEGYDLENLSNEELDAVSGGNIFNDIKVAWDWLTTKK